MHLKEIVVRPIKRTEESLYQDLMDAHHYMGGMRSLLDFFADIPDLRRVQGRRHRLSTVLAIAAGAVLCGMRGYKAIAGRTFAAFDLVPKLQLIAANLKGRRSGNLSAG